MKSMSVSRRTLLTGTVALGTVGLLAACGSSSKEKVGGSAANNAEDILKNLQVNKQDRSSLKQGGTLTLAATALGPNFNLQTQSGYTSSNLDALAPCNIPAVMGFYTMSPEGEGTLNPEFCTEHKTETVDGVQTATFKINPKAAFNDGTPMDVKAVQACWKVYRATTDNPYHITDNTMWQQVESIEAVDGDNFHVKVTMKAPYYPSEGLCAFAIHPALEDVNLFNEGFVDKPLDQYWAGPFKIGEWNSSQKVLTLVKNDKWWGEKPVLDRIIWRQMDSEAIRASFKNGELDAFTFVGATSYNAVKGQAGTEIRQSQNTNVNIIQLNPKRIEDLALRRAILASVDREQIAKAYFSQLGWTEPLPGSIIAMPFQKGYQNNYAGDTGAQAAGKILEAAGYSKSGDYYAKNGKVAGFALTSFGSEAVYQAVYQILEQQLKSAGIRLSADNQPQSNSNSVLGQKSYEAIFTGWGVLPDLASSAPYFFTTEVFGVGDPEVDKLIEKLQNTENADERIKIANEAEKLYYEKVAVYLPYANGPMYAAVKAKVANYGPSLFKQSYTSADYWVNVGWQE